MPLTFKVEPHVTQPQALVIPDVSATTDGLMTPDMLAKLNGLGNGYAHIEIDTGPALPMQSTLNFAAPYFVGTNNLGNASTDITILDATPLQDGLMSAADKAKLDALVPGGGGYNLIEVNTVTVLPQQPIINFAAPYFAGVDNPGNTSSDITILDATDVVSGLMSAADKTTFDATFGPQNRNFVFAAPAFGPPTGFPSFRALEAADIPALNYVQEVDVDSTLTESGSTSNPTLGLNLNSANTWTAIQTLPGVIDSAGLIMSGRHTVVGDYGLTTDDFYVEVNSPTPCTLTLPAGVSGQTFTMVDTSGFAQANPITVVGTGGQTINGAASQQIAVGRGWLTVEWNATASTWTIVNAFLTPSNVGTVTSVGTDATLTGGPITGAGTLGINLANANVWTALQTVRNNAVTTASVPGLELQNQTAATSGNQKSSPSLRMEGQGFTGAVSQTTALELQGRPGQAANPTMDLVLWAQQGAGAVTEMVKWGLNPSGTVATMDFQVQFPFVRTLASASTLFINGHQTDTLGAYNVEIAGTSGVTYASTNQLGIFNGGVVVAACGPTGKWMSDVGYDSLTAATPTILGGTSASQVRLRVAGVDVITTNGSAMFPSAGPNNISIGAAGLEFATISAYKHLGVEQDVTGNGAITINPTLGETYFLTANGNISSITVTAPASNTQTIYVGVKQDAAGTSTWPTTWGNVLFPGGATAKTLAANAIDWYILRYFRSPGKWFATSVYAALA